MYAVCLVRQEEGHEAIVLGDEYKVRQQLSLIVHAEAVKAIEAGGSLSVFVCRPEKMQNDVRNAVAKANLDVFLKVLSMWASTCTASTSRGHEVMCYAGGQYFSTAALR